MDRQVGRAAAGATKSLGREAPGRPQAVVPHGSVSRHVGEWMSGWVQAGDKVAVAPSKAD